MSKTRFNIKIGSKMWTVHRSKRPRTVSTSADKLYGEVDYQHRRIYLNPDARGWSLINTVIHEFAHARLQEWGESDIELFADQLCRLLRRLKEAEDNSE